MRRDIYLTTWVLLAAAIGARREGDLAKFLELLRIINGYREGEKPYSLAGRRALEDQSGLMRDLERTQKSVT